ncbi:peroxisomal biogenesis factor 1 isoform X2 [Rhodnius prolixus]|uniref:peroxisomal biogenesis factor 1 isoform X2 n=1 Tax=Rhodnius prolixus TaxID=13249 RepID=UPI003D18A56C
MSKEVLRLQFINVKNCFLHFPQVTHNNFCGSSVCALKLENNGKVYYFSPSISPHSSLTGSDFVGISSLYARLLGFKEGDFVIISAVNNLGSLRQIQVSPASEDDFEILLSASDAIETSLLNQLRIVWPQQVFCAWIAPNIAVTLVVDTVYPNLSFGRLEEYSEVIIGDAIQKKGLMPKEINSNPPHSIDGIEECDLDDKILICRCVVGEDILSTNYQPYVVSLSAENLPEWTIDLLKDQGKKVLWTIQKLYDDENNQSEPIKLRIKLIEDTNSRSSIAGYKSLFISLVLRYKLSLENGVKVLLRPLEDVDDLHSPATGLLVTPYFQENEELVKDKVNRSLFESIVKYGDLLINTKGEFVLNDGRIVALTLRPLNLNWAIFKVTDLTDLSISINKYTNVPAEWPEKITFNPATTTPLISALKKVLDQAEQSIVFSLGVYNSKRNPLFFDNLLITGSSGSGKTTLIKCLIEKVRGPPNFLFTAYIDCYHLKGKRLEIFGKQLLETLNNCYSKQPAVLFLDNLDVIAGVPKTDHEGTEATLHLNRISFKIVDLIEEYQRVGLIALIATAESEDKVNARLFSQKGETLFTSHIDIPQLSKDDRLEFLKLVIDDKMPHMQRQFESQDLNIISKRTSGFVAADLIKLTDKALFESWQRKEKGEILCLRKNDLDTALKNSKPSLLHGINVNKQSKILFSNVGGLNAAKEKLSEMILWQLMYPEIMNQCPLKAQNAVLLYGMPGTGKTLLANAVAGESKLNFITVKGPELMSKYIGQSEEGVRKIFEKAQTAKPCLLFFDEFDSLAPKRGQEQTGVTDRVVNQLLTALDGVQPLTGVSVLAATSRPDLIDKALLRPGRIGASVYCPLPNQEERLAILEVLSETIFLDDDVKLIDIAKETEGYTGADLKGLLTSAQIKLIDSFVEKSLEEGINMENILPNSLEQDNKWSVKVDSKHLSLALKECKPSLNQMERLKFQKIYMDYQNPSAPDISSLKLTFA